MTSRRHWVRTHFNTEFCRNSTRFDQKNRVTLSERMKCSLGSLWLTFLHFSAGRGNFAIVRLGIHKLTKSKVAVKIVDKVCRAWILMQCKFTKTFVLCVTKNQPLTTQGRSRRGQPQEDPQGNWDYAKAESSEFDQTPPGIHYLAVVILGKACIKGNR